MRLGKVGLLFAAGLSLSSSAATIEVSVTNFKELKGQLAWALFDAKDGFPSKRENALRRGFWPLPERAASKAIKELKVEGVLENVAAGEYALSVYQDMDGDGKLSTNWIGIPKEPVGVSLNPKLRMGPPRYDDSKFKLEDKIQIDIKLHH